MAGAKQQQLANLYKGLVSVPVHADSLTRQAACVIRYAPGIQLASPAGTLAALTTAPPRNAHQTSAARTTQRAASAFSSVPAKLS